MYRNKRFPIRQRQLADATRVYADSTPLTMDEIERAMRMGPAEQEYDYDSTFDLVNEEDLPTEVLGDEDLMKEVNSFLTADSKDQTGVGLSVTFDNQRGNEKSSTHLAIETDKPAAVGKLSQPITSKTIPNNQDIPPPQTRNDTTLDASSGSSTHDTTSSTITLENEEKEKMRKKKINEKTKRRNLQRKNKNQEGKLAESEAEKLKRENEELRAMLAAAGGPANADNASGSRPDHPKPSKTLVSSPPDPEAKTEVSGNTTGCRRELRVGQPIPALMNPPTNRVARMKTGPVFNRAGNSDDARLQLPALVDPRPEPLDKRPAEWAVQREPLATPRRPNTGQEHLPRHPQMGRPQELTRESQDAAAAGESYTHLRPSALKDLSKDYNRIIDGKIADLSLKWKMHQSSVLSLQRQLDELHHEKKRYNSDNPDVPNKRTKYDYDPPSNPISSQDRKPPLQASANRNRASTTARSSFRGSSSGNSRGYRGRGNGRGYGRGRGMYKLQENRIFEGQNPEGKDKDDEEAETTPSSRK